jgi:microcystin-dependent protein
MKYNKNLAGVQITDELINRASSASVRLAHDTILASTVVVRTAPAGGGTLLSLTTDYTLGSEDARLTTEAGGTVNTTLAIVNGARLNTNLYVSYKTVGDYAEAEDATPSGSILMFAGSTAPANWLLCDGAAVSRATYNKLFQAIGTTWGAGNGTTTFNLPDMRGFAPVGVGTSNNGTVDGQVHQSETWTLAQKRNDQAQGHKHDVLRFQEANGVQQAGTLVGVVDGSPTNISNRWATGNPIDSGFGTPRTGNVTRGKRVGVNFIIKV